MPGRLNMREKSSQMMLLAVALAVSACAGSPGESSVRVVVAGDQEAGHSLAPGDPLAGGIVRLFDGDVLVLEVRLDDDGRASVDPAAGSYDVQAFLESDDSGCFWGDTIYDVGFPRRTLLIEAFQICSG